jgi:hypothetical protein
MVKKVILTTLFLLLAAGIFGVLNTKAEAAVSVSCSTAKGWPGTCTGKINCTFPDPNIEWDDSITVCNSIPFALYHEGCCGTNPSPTNKICDFAGPTGSQKQKDCENCMGNGTGAWTALGCIQTDPQKFIGQILQIGVGIGGGIAFLLILFGGFQILMSAGNPEKLNAGKELITSAITGLLIIVFSLFILRLIGFNIFGIPGFG